jgi:hypothetical protein
VFTTESPTNVSQSPTTVSPFTDVAVGAEDKGVEGDGNSTPITGEWWLWASVGAGAAACCCFFICIGYFILRRRRESEDDDEELPNVNYATGAQSGSMPSALWDDQNVFASPIARSSVNSTRGSPFGSSSSFRLSSMSSLPVSGGSRRSLALSLPKTVVSEPEDVQAPIQYSDLPTPGGAPSGPAQASLGYGSMPPAPVAEDVEYASFGDLSNVQEEQQ